MVASRWRRIFRNHFVARPSADKEHCFNMQNERRIRRREIERYLRATRWYKYNISARVYGSTRASSPPSGSCMCEFFPAVYRENAAREKVVKRERERARQLERTRLTVCRGNWYSFGDERAPMKPEWNVAIICNLIEWRKSITHLCSFPFHPSD